MRVFSDVAELAEAVGGPLGTSEWHTVSQEQVQLFADATGDHQWIHLDAEKAAAGPFGTTIAHGFLTLSLIPAFLPEIYRVEGLKMGINYGLNKVRFPQPVKVGSRVRGTAELAELTDVPGGKQAVVRWTVEIEGEDKPACVAEMVSRLIL
ncbi:MaoC family dehydratase [Amycolatopsis rubida]|uniref:Acyl dehydratase n=1 Tax=Amycolatopsis rubida TaxID=112413 RepID=A0A1I5PM56_9PSEU|nr:MULTISPECIES: MaoC family dehydratase [Amycolatopsis]MYW92601.1 dehydratase [Amycolatopsis rubida]NEC57586.1 MaoC family dehydratase [Amycolatopsis rubida]OAP26237.1 putative enoyl-CoA hydratase 1 [Amycolatopsis sp. M39]SFP35202.1 Acyl dehydratase [Amycolatopsis rubida]